MQPRTWILKSDDYGFVTITTLGWKLERFEEVAVVEKSAYDVLAGELAQSTTEWIKLVDRKNRENHNLLVRAEVAEERCARKDELIKCLESALAKCKEQRNSEGQAYAHERGYDYDPAADDRELNKLLCNHELRLVHLEGGGCKTVCDKCGAG